MHKRRKGERVSAVFLMLLRILREEGVVCALLKDMEAYDQIGLQGNTKESCLFCLQVGHPQNILDLYLRQTTWTNDQDTTAQSLIGQT
jgi:hypothetical protein